MKKWTILQPNPEKVKALLQKSDLSRLCAEVLVSGGIDSIEKAAAFFSADELSDPFLLRDMEEAAEILNDAVESGKNICIYGDYDCDGICATVMLYLYLDSLGADVHYYIPERTEGYGMNKAAVRTLAERGTELIVTVDNGISAVEEADLIAELGMELVITDHHRPPEVLPKATAIVDPHRRDCSSPFKELCGAGVVLKLIAAMDGGVYDMALEQFSDLAAIATVADVVSLTGENRAIVEHGLHLLANTENLGLSALMKESKLSADKLSSTAAAFILAPRMNAAGRFGSPSTAVKLLLTDDSEEADALAAELSHLNAKRKETERAITQAIEKSIAENPDILNRRELVFYGEDWHHGVIGIVSARMTERYGKPCFILSAEEDGARGSARGVPGYSVYEALNACADLLERFGGHTGAGGFSLKKENIEGFFARLAKFSRSKHPSVPRLTLTAHKVLEARDLTVEQVESLDRLEPFGEANPRPVFALLGARVDEIQPLSEGKHTKLKLNYQGTAAYALLFGTSADSVRLQLKPGEAADLLVHTELNRFNGKTTVSMRALDYRKSGIPQAKYFAALEAYERWRLGEGVPDALKPRIVPTREELVAVYKAVAAAPVPADILFARLCSDSMNYCKLRLCLDIFCELGLICIEPVQNTVSLVSNAPKTDLNRSAILNNLRCL